VRHNGGLWQATKRTASEPGAGSEWALLAQGVKSVGCHIKEDGTVRMETTMSDGTVYYADSEFALPTPKARGVWKDGEQYARYDAVVKDGHTFMALVDAPCEIGVKAGDWLCIGHRGKAGRNAKAVDKSDLLAALRPTVVTDLMRELPELVATAVEALR
jgi:hypothetical protein